VDDGSTDRTDRIVVSLAKKDSRLLYVHQKNKGLAEARNVGLALAAGSYVTFLDSDDEYRKTHLAKRLRYMKRNSKVDALHGGITLVGPRSKHYVPDLSKEGRKIHLAKCFASGTIFTKRSVLRRVGGFRNIGFGEDYDLVKRLMKKHVVRRVHWPTYVYHTESSNRLCALYEEGGEPAIYRFRMHQSS
jgi:glycosyltransferase involved in cell wall biosynthesis